MSGGRNNLHQFQSLCRARRYAGPERFLQNLARYLNVRGLIVDEQNELLISLFAILLSEDQTTVIRDLA